jgi:hypothetical protein
VKTRIHLVTSIKSTVVFNRSAVSSQSRLFFHRIANREAVVEREAIKKAAMAMVDVV